MGEAAGGCNYVQGGAAAGTINSFLGLLARRTRKIANLDEMSDAAAAGPYLDENHYRLSSAPRLLIWGEKIVAGPGSFAQCGELRGESSWGGCRPVEKARNSLRTNRYLAS
jgi:hypothetical protein